MGQRNLCVKEEENRKEERGWKEEEERVRYKEEKVSFTNS